MTFKARVFIQGAGCYVPHVDADKLLVLFPNHNHSRVADVAVPHTGAICDHHFVVQFDARCLNSSLPPGLWTSFDLCDHWVGFDTDSQQAMQLPNGTVPGPPSILEMLTKVGLGGLATLNPRALPGGNFQPELLVGGFYAEQGAISPHSSYEGAFQLRTRNGAAVANSRATFASVVRLELGEVNHFDLTLRSFDGNSDLSVPLSPPTGNLDVWIRYFCDLRRPDPARNIPQPGDLDVDFVMAYLLRKDLDQVLDNQVRGRLPVPEVRGSWQDGGTIGGDPRRCMGPVEQPLAFSSPLDS